MTQKSHSGAKLIRPNDPGHGVTSESFAELVLTANRALNSIEAELNIASPDDTFRRSLAGVLWGYYLASIETNAASNRAALKKELRRAADLADKLETSASRIWRSRDPAITDHLERFGTMFQHWQPSHPSGVAWVGLLHEFMLTTQLLADTLEDDAGGPRKADAFTDLVDLIAEHVMSRGGMGNDIAVVLRDASFARLMMLIVDILRKIAPHLPAANFQLPPSGEKSDSALRKRLHRMSPRT